MFFKRNHRSLDSSHIEKIFEWTRMQTYYAQIVCNKLFGKSSPIDQNLLDDVFNEIIQQEIPVFSSYQRLLTAYQWKVLVAVAKSEHVENPHAQRFIQQYELGAVSSVSTALKTLVKKEFVIFQDHHYTLHDTLLMRWLQGL